MNQCSILSALLKVPRQVVLVIIQDFALPLQKILSYQD
jgi:hypothetical protein